MIKPRRKWEVHASDAVARPTRFKSDVGKCFVAAQEDNVSALRKALVENPALINVADTDGSRRTIAMYAAASNSLGALGVLVELHADFTVRNAHGQTALLLAVKNNLGAAARRLMPVSPINAVDSMGVSALMLAAKSGDEPTLRALLAAGADVSLRSKEDWTALHEAAVNGNLPIVEALLDAGADWSAKAGVFTPAQLAKIYRKKDVHGMLSTFAVRWGRRSVFVAVVVAAAHRRRQDCGGTPLQPSPHGPRVDRLTAALTHKRVAIAKASCCPPCTSARLIAAFL